MAKSKAKAKRRVKRKTARIYYGPEGRETSMYWTVLVTDAKKNVTIKGNAAAALRAHRGVTVGCAISGVCMDDGQAFPHPALMVSVTKSTVLVVDKLAKDGTPLHAWRYGHCYGRIVDSNDTGALKESPELMERPFILTVPRKRPTGPHEGHTRVATASSRSVLHLRGALERAVVAGRISRAVAEQLSHPNRTAPRAAA